MKRYTILVVSMMLLCCGLAQQVQASTVPRIHGLQAFTMQTAYMSMTGYLRWQYFKENNVWISQQEVGALVKAQ